MMLSLAIRSALEADGLKFTNEDQPRVIRRKAEWTSDRNSSEINKRPVFSGPIMRP